MQPRMFNQRGFSTGLHPFWPPRTVTLCPCCCPAPSSKKHWGRRECTRPLGGGKGPGGALAGRYSVSLPGGVCSLGFYNRLFLSRGLCKLGVVWVEGSKGQRGAGGVRGESTDLDPPLAGSKNQQVTYPRNLHTHGLEMGVNMVRSPPGARKHLLSSFPRKELSRIPADPHSS